MIAYLGIGGNEENSLGAIQNVLSAIKEEPSLSLNAVSSLYKNKAWGFSDQADFFNMVVEIDTEMKPLNLLDFCLMLEQRIGRQRSSDQKWGPRLIDIDILSYENCINKDQQLTLPHPYLLDREFFYIPLLEIAPDVKIPGIGLIKDIVNSNHSMTIINQDFEV